LHISPISRCGHRCLAPSGSGRWQVAGGSDQRQRPASGAAVGGSDGGMIASGSFERDEYQPHGPCQSPRSSRNCDQAGDEGSRSSEVDCRPGDPIGKLGSGKPRRRPRPHRKGPIESLENRVRLGQGGRQPLDAGVYSTRNHDSSAPCRADCTLPLSLPRPPITAAVVCHCRLYLTLQCPRQRHMNRLSGTLSWTRVIENPASRIRVGYDRAI